MKRLSWARRLLILLIVNNWVISGNMPFDSFRDMWVNTMCGGFVYFPFSKGKWGKGFMYKVIVKVIRTIIQKKC